VAKSSLRIFILSGYIFPIKLRTERRKTPPVRYV
jgi:hypothetical protein